MISISNWYTNAVLTVIACCLVALVILRLTETPPVPAVVSAEPLAVTIAGVEGMDAHDRLMQRYGAFKPVLNVRIVGVERPLPVKMEQGERLDINIESVGGRSTHIPSSLERALPVRIVPR